MILKKILLLFEIVFFSFCLFSCSNIKTAENRIPEIEIITPKPQETKIITPSFGLTTTLEPEKKVVTSTPEVMKSPTKYRFIDRKDFLDGDFNSEYIVVSEIVNNSEICISLVSQEKEKILWFEEGINDYAAFSISPDGKRIVGFSENDETSSFIYDFLTKTRLLLDDKNDGCLGIGWIDSENLSYICFDFASSSSDIYGYSSKNHTFTKITNCKEEGFDCGPIAVSQINDDVFIFSKTFQGSGIPKGTGIYWKNVDCLFDDECISTKFLGVEDLGIVAWSQNNDLLAIFKTDDNITIYNFVDSKSVNNYQIASGVKRNGIWYSDDQKIIFIGKDGNLYLLNLDDATTSLFSEGHYIEIMGIIKPNDFLYK